MAKSKRPFMLTKEFWQTDSVARKIAQAKHQLAGEQLDRRLAELEITDVDKLKVENLKIDKKYGKVSDVEFDKQSATLKGEPYVGVLKTHFNPQEPKNGFFELDWNDKFIEDLMTSGYTGEKDEEVINKWFNDLCRNIMLEDMDEDVVDALKENIKENKKELGDGKVEYS
tara:strand:+ start:980 stop:1489 length:510 start_codon:yes stop_codon:yes gene_type:complete